MTGVLASAVGLFVGLGLAKGLDALSRPSAPTCRRPGSCSRPRTVIVSLVVGTVVTAAREPPAGASRDARAADRGRARGIDPAALAARALRPAGRARDLRASRSPLVLFGAFGHGMADRPAAAPRSASACSGSSSAWRWSRRRWRARSRPRSAGPRPSSAASPATLARSNSMRNPSRTASTAAALMIGLALVTTVSVLAAGPQARVRGRRRRRVPRRLRAHLPERLHARPRSTPRTRCASPGVATVVAGVRAGDGACVRQEPPASRGVEPGLSPGAAAEMEGGLRRLARRARPARRDRRQRATRREPPHGRLAARGSRPRAGSSSRFGSQRSSRRRVAAPRSGR